jgi:hypothetical protein
MLYRQAMSVPLMARPSTELGRFVTTAQRIADAKSRDIAADNLKPAGDCGMQGIYVTVVEQGRCRSRRLLKM